VNSPLYVPSHEGAAERTRWPLEADFGTYGIYTLIATESLLFVCLFASYFFLNSDDRWTADQPPKLMYALIMLCVLLFSSFVLNWGERQMSAARYGAARAALWLTVLLGLGFTGFQCLEYADHWKTLTPMSDSYGSIFYAITTFHAAHVVMGLLILAYVGILPTYAPTRVPPYRPYHVAALYWHFVDIVWIFVVGLLYILPNLQGHPHA